MSEKNFIADKHKIIFAGDVAAGKTTAISSVSDIPPMNTDVNASNPDEIGKKTTTVAFDYGEIKLPALQNKLRLYGLPGQKRFDFIWEMVCENATGIILLVDNSKPSSLKETEEYIEFFIPYIRDLGIPSILGITKSDIASYHNSREFQEILLKEGVYIPVFSIDPREKSDILLMINALLSQIEAKYFTRP